MIYVVDVFDGISGDSAEFENLEDAERYLEKEKARCELNKYHYEMIELYAWDEETQEKIETIKMEGGKK